MNTFKLMVSLGLILCSAFNSASSQHLRIASRATSYEPGQENTQASESILSEMFDGLLTLDKNWNLRGLGAERWEIENEGKRYRFFLRKDNFWSDGTPVTAKDYALGLRFANHSNSSFFPLDKLRDKKGDIHVEAESEYQLLINMAAPFSISLSAFSSSLGMPRPSHLLKSDTALWTELKTKICNGPMCPTSITKSGVILTPNPYYRHSPFWKKISFIHYTKDNKALEKYRNNDIDLFPYVPARQAVWAKSRLPEELHEVVNSSSIALLYHNHKGRLKDVSFRRALAKNINYTNMARVTNNPDPSYYGLIPKGFGGYSSRHFPKSITDNWPRKPSNITMRAYKGLTSELVANQLKRDWHKIGVKVTIELTTQRFEDYLKDYDDGKFDIALIGVLSSSGDSLEFLEEFSKGIDSTRHIHNDKFESMIDKIKIEPAPKERNKLIADAENYLLSDTVGTITSPLPGLLSVLAKPRLSGVEKTLSQHPDFLYRWSEIRINEKSPSKLSASTPKDNL